METTAKQATIRNHVKSGHPLILVESADEQQVISDAAKLQSKEHNVYLYSSTGLLIDYSRREEKGYDPPEMDWEDLVTIVKKNVTDEGCKPSMVIIAFDAQRFIDSIYRHFLDASTLLKKHGNCFVLVAPDWASRPPEMLHAAPILEFDLPDRDQLGQSLDRLSKDHDIDLNGHRDAIIDAAKGLTVAEAENAYYLSVVETKQTGTATVDQAIVAREKMRLIRGTGFMDVQEPLDPAMIGGMESLKTYLRDAVSVKDDPQLMRRGIILAGPQGNGKSLAVKCTGAIMERPVLMLRLSECKGGFVGQSEANLRTALRLAEAIAPCILAIDEIDKALAGSESSGATDGGTSIGMLGILLNWLADHKFPICTVATCNDYHKLPGSLTRDGRFDGRFFVDLPVRCERRAIAEIHFNRLNCELANADKILDYIASYCVDWAGSEIEAACKNAARIGKRKVTLVIVKKAIKDVKPMIESQKTQIEAQRDRLKNILFRANSPDVEPSKAARKLDPSVN